MGSILDRIRVSHDLGGQLPPADKHVMRPLSYATYVTGHRQATVWSAQRARSTIQCCARMLRAAVVDLSGHFEAFLNSLGRMLADQIESLGRRCFRRSGA